MDNKIERFLIKAKFDKDKFYYFEGATLKEVIVNKKTTDWLICINLDNLLPIDVYKELKIASKSIKESRNIDFSFTFKNGKELLKDYFYYLINEYVEYSPSFGFLLENDILFDDNIITIETLNEVEENKVKEISKKFSEKLVSLGFEEIKINSFINETKRDEVKKMIENTSPIPVIKEVSENKVIIGTEIKGKKTEIKDIIGEDNDCILEVNLFGLESRELKNNNYLFTMKITDNTDSISAKIFTYKKEIVEALNTELKVGKWYLMRGYVKYDDFAHDLVFNIRDIESISKSIEKRKDTAPVKRVELHAHTMMSQMDGLIGVDLGKHTCDLVTEAIRLGHPAVAITDHDGCQSFPIAYEVVKSHNKKLLSSFKDKVKELEGKLEENKDDVGLNKELEDAKNALEEAKKKQFKGLYGVELEMSENFLNVVFNPNDSLLSENTYVIFDVETTGFNAGLSDSIIEIGAVKMKDGIVIDSFDELINSGKPLRKEITKLTGITDAMLSSCDNEENATKRFKEFIGDLPLVAHNAKFDKSFLDSAYSKYNLGKLTNPILDTMIISQLINPLYKNHKLSTLAKNYGIEFDENDEEDTTTQRHHHRADYDAENTGYIFMKMLKEMDKLGINTLNDLFNYPTEEQINRLNRESHINIIAKSRVGLKNMFKLISFAGTKYIVRNARIPRREVTEHREDLLIGSGCYNSEVWKSALTQTEEALKEIIKFYDYVEVQPPSNYSHLVFSGDVNDENEVLNAIKKIIKCAKEVGVLVVATCDAHTLTKEDKIYREIIVNQNVPGKGRHPLARYIHSAGYDTIPDQYFRTTDEMLEEFAFLGEELAYEIVVENTRKVPEMCEQIEVIIDTGGVPFSPKIENSEQQTRDMVYNRAHEIYGDPLPENIEKRIEDELKGIIGGGFDVIYLIAQKLVKHSNDEGYLVGSRGSVGSSFVATMMGITEVNPLPAHYVCPNCKHSVFIDDDGIELGSKYSSGFDLPDKACPKCGTPMGKDGQDMPFATFLGFNADKVPDIDLNFSGDNQASAQEYTKVLFGEDNVYRAGTIGTVADKTAYGFVLGYYEDKYYDKLKRQSDITGEPIPSKDVLKKEKKLKVDKRVPEIERLAVGCTGVKRTTGQHPGGIVVVPGYMDVFDFTPFQYPADDPGSAWRTTHFDYHAIDQDLLKLDILGHVDPTMLRMLQDLSGLDVTKVPLDDKDTMSIFQSPAVLGVTEEQILCPTGTLGVPEFGTKFVIGMLQDTKPSTFSELIKISGLSHGTDVWLGNAQELIKNNIVPFKEVIGCRDDIMVYLSYHGVEKLKAFKIMEFVRKGKASKDPATWAGFVEDMKKAGIEEWYIDSCGKIKYMFPKAHAAAYVTSAYRIAWFKVHHPIYYYCAYFSVRSNDFDILTMINGYEAIKAKMEDLNNRKMDLTNKEASIYDELNIALECTARGISFTNLDINKSEANYFKIEGNNLIPPFRTIDGLGGTVAEKIVAERNDHPFVSIEDLQKRGGVSTTLIEKMRMMGMLEGLPESSQLSLF